MPYIASAAVARALGAFKTATWSAPTTRDGVQFQTAPVANSGPKAVRFTTTIPDVAPSTVLACMFDDVDGRKGTDGVLHKTDLFIEEAVCFGGAKTAQESGAFTVQVASFSKGRTAAAIEKERKTEMPWSRVSENAAPQDGDVLWYYAYKKATIGFTPRDYLVRITLPHRVDLADAEALGYVAPAGARGKDVWLMASISDAAALPSRPGFVRGHVEWWIATAQAVNEDGTGGAMVQRAQAYDMLGSIPGWLWDFDAQEGAKEFAPIITLARDTEAALGRPAIPGDEVTVRNPIRKA